MLKAWVAKDQWIVSYLPPEFLGLFILFPPPLWRKQRDWVKCCCVYLTKEEESQASLEPLATPQDS